MQIISWPPLIATIVIELPVVALCAMFLRVPAPLFASVSVLLNGITQPLLSAALRHVLFGQGSLYWQYFALGEVFVWLVEAAAYAWFLRGRRNTNVCALALSGIANGTSLLVGLLLPY